MNGRLINEIKIDKATRERVERMPRFIQEWHMNMTASGTTALTRKIYVYYAQNFLETINEDIKSITPDLITEKNVNDYFIKIKTKQNNNGISYTSDSYQATMWSCLNSLFEYMKLHKYIETNYMEFITRPKNRDLDRINENRVLLTENDFSKIIKCVYSEKNEVKRCRDLAVIVLLMNTGMRETALTNIMIDDIDYKEKKELIIIDKGRKRHVYKLSDDVCKIISLWIKNRQSYNKKNDEHLFLTNRGTSLSADSVYDIVSRYTEKALGKKLSPHKLRSGYCSILYEKTGDIEFVRRAVGHASSITTQRYIVTKGDEKEKAAAIMSSILA